MIDDSHDLTRRQWLLCLSEFVALAGVSGIVPEFTTQLSAAPQAALPPGLYDPSQDHLVHALSSAGLKWSPPPGSETEYVQRRSEPYRPQFFSGEDWPVVTRFVEILLGNVDPAALSQAVQWFDLWLTSAERIRMAARQLDPLHRILAVAYYGEESVRELETADPQATARAGVHALRDLSQRLYGRDFLHLTSVEQIELVTTASKAESGPAVHRWFDLARGEAIRGYYTSADGLKELDYKGNAYYGDSPGCEGKTD
jgi:hypothetical protein